MRKLYRARIIPYILAHMATAISFKQLHLEQELNGAHTPRAECSLIA